MILNFTGAHRFCHKAMATTFEIFIVHSDTRYARQAACAGFDELDRLEAELSRFIENSDICRLNNLAAGRSLRVGPAVFECLQLCDRMYAQTNGTFDVTLGSASSGCRLKLDKAQYTVQQPAKAVKIDLGGIGKGYAVDKMAELLGDWSIDTALIHGGYSSVLALGAPPETKGWPITLSSPGNHKQVLAKLHLQDRAISGSGLQDGRHIIDPRTAQPVEDKRAAWACAPDAATTDALSTAFMVMSPDEVKDYCLRHSDTLAMIVTKDGDTETQKDKVLRFGYWKANA
jgi:thiamine biosynthesis lipoprotein